jgi:hypothetical protein
MQRITISGAYVICFKANCDLILRVGTQAHGVPDDRVEPVVVSAVCAANNPEAMLFIISMSNKHMNRNLGRNLHHVNA